MLQKIKRLSAITLLALMVYGCDSDNNDGGAGSGVPDTTRLPSESLEDILSAGVTDDARALNLTAIQAELNSLSGGTRDADPVEVVAGDTATSLLNRSRVQ
ncbi:MAG: hypothetical protein KTR32_38545 [Granulosicoccus sp.]|nr:hypothetical protein [Granulosicoccus sp.]